ncbi:hypothetical protein DIPPA_05072 [Diplonema papillatum]|nr:hypothetical protein DIPPA_05072 [Diplonema papillatum]
MSTPLDASRRGLPPAANLSETIPLEPEFPYDAPRNPAPSPQSVAGTEPGQTDPEVAFSLIRKKLRGVLKSVKNLRSENDDLREARQEAERAAGDLKASEASLREEMRAQREPATARGLPEADALMDEVKALREKRAIHEEEIEITASVRQRTAAEVEALSEELKALRERKARDEEQANAAAEEKKRATEEVESVANELKALRERKALDEEQADVAAEEKKRATEEIESVANELKALRERKALDEEEADVAAGVKKRATEEVESVANELKALQEKRALHDEETRRAKAETGDLARELDALREERASHERAIRAEEERLEALRAEREAVEASKQREGDPPPAAAEEVEKLRKELSWAASEKVALEAEVESLKKGRRSRLKSMTTTSSSSVTSDSDSDSNSSLRRERDKRAVIEKELVVVASDLHAAGQRNRELTAELQAERQRAESLGAQLTEKEKLLLLLAEQQQQQDSRSRALSASDMSPGLARVPSEDLLADDSAEDRQSRLLLPSANSRNNDKVSTDRLEQQIDALNREKAALQEQVAELQAAAREILGTSSADRSVKREKEKRELLERQLEDAERELDAVSRQNKALREGAADRSSASSSENSAVEKEKSKREKVEKQREEAEAEVAALNREKRDLQDEAAALRRELDALRSKETDLQAVTEQNRSLLREVAEAKAAKQVKNRDSGTSSSDSSAKKEKEKRKLTEQQLEDAEQQLDSLKQRNRDLEESIARLHSEREVQVSAATDRNVKREKQQKEQAEQLLEDAERELEALSRENKGLKLEIEVIKSKASRSKDTDSASSSGNAAKREKEKRKQAEQQLEDAERELDALSRENKTLHDDVADLKSELKSKEADAATLHASAVSERSIKREKDKREQAELQLEEAESELAALSRENRSLHDELTAVKSRTTRDDAATSDSSSSSSSSMSSSIAAGRKQAKKEKKKRKHAERQLESARRENKALRGEVESLKSAPAASEDRSALREKERRKEAERQLKAAEDELDALGRENRALLHERTAEVHRSGVSALSEQHEAEKARLEDLLEESEEENRALHDELVVLKSRGAVGREFSASSINTAIDTRPADARGEAFPEQRSIAEPAKNEKRLETLLAESERQNEALRGEVAVLESRATTDRRHSVGSVKTKDERQTQKRLETLLDAAEEENKALHDEVAALKSRATTERKHSTTSSTAPHSKAQLQQLLEASEQEVQSLQDEVAVLKSRATTGQRHSTASSINSSRAPHSKAQLEPQLEAYEQEIRSLQDEVAVLKSRATTGRRHSTASSINSSRAPHSKAQLEPQLEAYEQEIRSLQDEVAVLKSRATTGRRHSTASSVNSARAQQQLEHLLGASEQENKQLHGEIAALRSRATTASRRLSVSSVPLTPGNASDEEGDGGTQPTSGGAGDARQLRAQLEASERENGALKEDVSRLRFLAGELRARQYGGPALSPPRDDVPLLRVAPAEGGPSVDLERAVDALHRQVKTLAEENGFLRKIIEAAHPEQPPPSPALRLQHRELLDENRALVAASAAEILQSADPDMTSELTELRTAAERLTEVVHTQIGEDDGVDGKTRDGGVRLQDEINALEVENASLRELAELQGLDPGCHDAGTEAALHGLIDRNLSALQTRINALEREKRARARGGGGEAEFSVGGGESDGRRRAALEEVVAALAPLWGMYDLHPVAATPPAIDAKSIASTQPIPPTLPDPHASRVTDFLSGASSAVHLKNSMVPSIASTHAIPPTQNPASRVTNLLSGGGAPSVVLPEDSDVPSIASTHVIPPTQNPNSRMTTANLLSGGLSAVPKNSGAPSIASTHAIPPTQDPASRVATTNLLSGGASAGPPKNSGVPSVASTHAIPPTQAPFSQASTDGPSPRTSRPSIVVVSNRQTNESSRPSTPSEFAASAADLPPPEEQALAEGNPASARSGATTHSQNRALMVQGTGDAEALALVLERDAQVRGVVERAFEKLAAAGGPGDSEVEVLKQRLRAGLQREEELEEQLESALAAGGEQWEADDARAELADLRAELAEEQEHANLLKALLRREIDILQRELEEAAALSASEANNLHRASLEYLALNQDTPSPLRDPQTDRYLHAHPSDSPQATDQQNSRGERLLPAPPATATSSAETKDDANPASGEAEAPERFPSAGLFINFDSRASTVDVAKHRMLKEKVRALEEELASAERKHSRREKKEKKEKKRNRSSSTHAKSRSARTEDSSAGTTENTNASHARSLAAETYRIELDSQRLENHRLRAHLEAYGMSPDTLDYLAAMSPEEWETRGKPSAPTPRDQIETLAASLSDTQRRCDALDAEIAAAKRLILAGLPRATTSGSSSGAPAAEAAAFDAPLAVAVQQLLSAVATRAPPSTPQQQQQQQQPRSVRSAPAGKEDSEGSFAGGVLNETLTTAERALQLREEELTERESRIEGLLAERGRRKEVEREKVATVRRDLEDTKVGLSESQAIVTRQSSIIAALRSSIDELERQKVSPERLEAYKKLQVTAARNAKALDEAHAEIAELRRSLARASPSQNGEFSAVKRALRQAELSLQTAQNEKEALRSALQGKDDDTITLQRELTKELAEQSEAMKDLQKRIGAAEQKAAAARTEKEALRSALKGKDDESVTLQRELTKELAEQSENMKELLKRVGAAEQKAETARLNAVKLRQEVLAREVKIDELEDALAKGGNTSPGRSRGAPSEKLAALEEEIERKNRVVQSLSKAAETSDRQLATAEFELMGAKAEIAKLTDQLSRRGKQLEAIAAVEDDRAHHSGARSRQRETEVGRLSQEMSSRTTTVQGYYGSTPTAARSSALLSVDPAKRESEALFATLRSMRQDLEGLSILCADARDPVKEGTPRLAEMQARLQFLQSKLTSTEETLIADRANFIDERAAYQNAIDGLQQRLPPGRPPTSEFAC